MSGYEQKDFNGVLFKNDKKEKPNHPDYKGNGMVFGEEVWISAWVKDGKNGKFLSLAFNAKSESGAKTGETKEGGADGLPF